MKKILGIIILSLVLSGNAYADEITDIEWGAYKLSVRITYYHQTAKKVVCTAFNLDKKPIGGETSYFDGTVATVNIYIPKKYGSKPLDEIDVKCKTK